MVKTSLQLNSPAETARLLADRIRAERLRRGWKQSTLAARSGVSVPTIRRYERSARTSVENLLKLCHALGRVDEFAELLKSPEARSMAELATHAANRDSLRKRGVR
ncbi:MAG: helix-turn-helix transcriptional regulator [Deltaproteobacteria bacterium]